MRELAAVIREAAAHGGLTGITLWPCSGGWQASVRRAGSEGWAVRINEDPAAALDAALGLPCPADPAEDIFG